MSHPPPPNQPPGESGPPAPPTPPSAPAVPPDGQPGQPGYGYPQPPPGGYGYPQHQQQPGGYGYPQQQPGFGPPTSPGVYGAPTPPGPYGAPPPGPYGPGAPPPGGGTGPGAGGGGGGAGGRGPKIALVVAAVLALLFAGGGTVWLLNDDGDGGPASADSPNEDDGRGERGPGGVIESSLAWEVPSPHIPEDGNLVTAYGTWFAGDTFVRMMHDSVTAYDLATGEEAWRFALERGNGECQASRTADEDRVVLLRGRDCEEVTVLNIATGEELNTFSIDSSLTFGSRDYPALLGDTIAIGNRTGGLGYSVDGEKLWDESVGTSRCPEVAYTVIDDMLVSQRACGIGSADGGHIRATTADGEELWQWEHGPTYAGQPMVVDSVVSVEPLVVIARVGESDASYRMLVIDEEREEVAHELEYDRDRFPDACQLVVFDDCGLAVVADGHLYLPSNPRGGDNAVVAFDLATGQAIYEVGPITSTGGYLRPFGELDGEILVYQTGTTEVEGLVMTLDPATEELSALMTMERAHRDLEQQAMGLSPSHDQALLWHDDTFVVVNRVFYASMEDRPAHLVYR